MTRKLKINIQCIFCCSTLKFLFSEIPTLDFAIDDYEYTFSIPVIGINSTQTHTHTHTLNIQTHPFVLDFMNQLLNILRLSAGKYKDNT